MISLLITTAGPLTTVQDLGRPGYAHIGVPHAGALDRGALRLGNRLLGNREGAAALEITVGGFEAVFSDECWFVVTGAWAPLRLDGEPVDPHAPTRALAGQSLSIGVAERGLRSYLSVRGGFAAPPVLGSRSRDTLAGIGPAVITDGDELPIGKPPADGVPTLEIAPWGPPGDGRVEVGVHAGPRQDWFTAASVDRFFTSPWELSPESNRIGARLLGPPLERERDDELPSEGMFAGAIQVPPSGLPTVLLADHPVTGGYPVIGVVRDADLDAFAQLRPGQQVAFRHA
ncbi:biotin-dependent carboxylase uncharacterized domain-containing protein [Paramicrobacterium humi]|uniref:Biotin-dependent carboxylase uncharacterized domain-containing protein n=1 Tax=Paramicrobacterium humi TaxID=640635 RepID=A0A1H4J4B9_9MICO|nr:biotin-dependent carboxyltransferase family protein [Microbacterium humi]SEB41067.1 biotin-dependent carboxylase uncharacterized domain-containing protein [Microbacterium humi]